MTRILTSLLTVISLSCWAPSATAQDATTPPEESAPTATEGDTPQQAADGAEADPEAPNPTQPATAPPAPASPPPNAEVARQLFLQGRQMLEEAGDEPQTSTWMAALELFRRSYQLHPTPEALFNGAFCQNNLGQFIEATRGMEEYLARFGEGVSLARRERARSALEALHRRVARLIVRSPSSRDISLSLNGSHIDLTAAERGLILEPGRYSVSATAPNTVPFRREIILAAGDRSTVTVDLLPDRGGVATITVACPLPGAQILIDGRLVGQTPLTDPDFSVSVGDRVVEARREGYESARVEVHLVEGDEQRATLEPRPSDELSDELAAQLNVDVDQRRAEVLVDGNPIGGGRIPAGLHVVEVHRAGYQTWRSEIELSAGETRSLDVELERADDADTHRRRVYRRASLASGSVGLAALATWTGLFIWNQGRRDDYEAEQRALRDEDAPNRDVRIAAQIELRENMENVDLSGWIVFGVGAVAMGAALVLLLGSRSPREEAEAALLPAPGGAMLRVRW